MLTPTQIEHLKRQALGVDGACGVFDREAFAKLCAHYREEHEDEYLGKAIELWTAGWTSETPHRGQAAQMMSWYWRRPGPRGGRRFLSTDQALNALRKGKP